MNEDRNKALVESMLFASSRPLGVGVIQEVTGLEKDKVNQILEILAREYESQGRGMRLKEVASGYQFRTLPEFSAEIGRMHQARPRRRLSRSALETLAIIAYRQPVTRAEVEQIRGVDSGAVLKTLMSLDMIRLLGRKEAPGRPMLYGTTRVFLEYFELRDLESLPTLEEIADLGEAMPDGQKEEERWGIGEEGKVFRAQDFFRGPGGGATEPETWGRGEEEEMLDTGNGGNWEGGKADFPDPDHEKKVLTEKILAELAEKIKS